MTKKIPSLIFVTGTDGSGKTCISNWLVERLRDSGISTALVWSRFNNYLSKPFLGITRLSGHNYYRMYNGVKFGFHDFEKLSVIRNFFAVLQLIDVNIATYLYIKKPLQKFDVVVCERGPWDTLMDIVVDTSLFNLLGSSFGQLFTAQVHNNKSLVLFIKRSKINILCTRPELIHDYKLVKKIAVYNQSANIYGWKIIDNNASLAETHEQINRILRLAQGKLENNDFCTHFDIE